MSTFRGIVAEFPDIRIDYFRPRPFGRPPLACFLSHIHSDHLQGLAGFYGGPFIYCSEATKELLVRLQRRAHRVNFQKQIIEARNYTYKDKLKILRPIPLETPTRIELGNGKSIRVTLFDANHCPGACMFLIEDEKHSILYTGDIRAEPWWVEAIARHPVLVPYTTGIKRLSKIYLDTSYASLQKVYKDFPTKAEGIRELLEKMMKYPKDTTFHFNTWTFGYEDIWVALASAFDTKIHVDKYQHTLFRSIRSNGTSTQGPYFNGFTFGNHNVEGRLTLNPDVRIHSCDRRLDCEGLQGKKVAWIVPLVNRIGNVEIQEDGIGQGDLESHSELSLDNETLTLLLNLLGSRISSKAQEMLKLASHSRSEALPLDWNTEDKVTFNLLIELLGKIATSKEPTVDSAEIKKQWGQKIEDHIIGENGEFLPTRISFIYPRHSSYNELRHLVSKFRPLDVYPCVVDELNWSKATSIRELFGDLCSGDRFMHDERMEAIQSVLEIQVNAAKKVEEGKGNGKGNGNRKGKGKGKEKVDVGSIEEHQSSSQVHSDRSQRGDSSDDEDDAACYSTLKGPEGLKFGSTDTARTPPLGRPISLIKSRLKREASNQGVVEVKRSRLEIVTTTIPAEYYGDDGSTMDDGEDEEIGSTQYYLAHETKLQPRPLPTPPTPNFISKHSNDPTPISASTHTPSHPVTRSSRSSSTATTSATPSSGTMKEYGKLDIDKVRDAVECALGIDGKCWWDVHLQSTRKKWKYVEEVEL